MNILCCAFFVVRKDGLTGGSVGQSDASAHRTIADAAYEGVTGSTVSSQGLLNENDMNVLAGSFIGNSAGQPGANAHRTTVDAARIEGNKDDGSSELSHNDNTVPVLDQDTHSE